MRQTGKRQTTDRNLVCCFFIRPFPRGENENTWQEAVTHLAAGVLGLWAADTRAFPATASVRKRKGKEEEEQLGGEAL